MIRLPTLQGMIDRLQDALAGADLSAPARVALVKVFDRLKVPGPVGVLAGVPHDQPAGQSAAEVLAVTDMLAPALAALTARPDALAALARSLTDLAPALVWTTRKAVGPTASAGFPAAHANTMLVGPGGLEDRADVMIGLSLMAPHTRYPDHDHAPEEVYLVLSDGAFLQGDADWLARKPGQTVYNSPGLRHAMRAGGQPFLALWCLQI